MFTPLNNHVEVELIEQESLIATQGHSYEEKGKVLSTAGIMEVKIGDVVFFDSWMSARYPDAEGKMRCLVPWDAIRAKESNED